MPECTITHTPQSFDLPEDGYVLQVQNGRSFIVIEAMVAENADNFNCDHDLYSNQKQEFSRIAGATKLWLRTREEGTEVVVTTLVKKSSPAAAPAGSSGLTEAEVLALIAAHTPIDYPQRDTQNRTFGRSYEVGFTTQTVTIRDGFDARYSFAIPNRNDSTSWGGGYTTIEYSVNGGAFQKKSANGYQNCMGLSAAIIRTDTYECFFNRGAGGIPQNGDFTLAVRLKHRSYNGTLRVNDRRGSVDPESASLHIISEVKTG